MPKIQYDSRITFGNLISTLGMIGGMIMLWVNLNVRLARMDVQQNYQNEGIRKIEEALMKSVETQTQLTRQADRLTTILEMMEKRPVPAPLSK